MDEQRTNDYLIKELERVQNELNRTEEIARLGSWSMDVHSRLLHWSGQTYRLFGKEKSTYTPTLESVLEMIHPEDRQEIAEAMEECLERGAPLENQFRVVRENGGISYLYAKGEKGGNTFFGTVQEISEQVETQQALAGINKKLRQYVNIVDEYVLITTTDLAGNITSASEAFCKASGYHRDELIGKNHRIVRHPEMPAWAGERPGGERSGTKPKRGSPSGRRWWPSPCGTKRGRRSAIRPCATTSPPRNGWKS